MSNHIFLKMLLFHLIKLATCDTIPGNITDVSQCKVSRMGLEFQGSISKTESGVRCQTWSTDAIHKVDAAYTDKKFPELSKKLAKNYCRNPNRDLRGPWCYTMDPNLIDDTCGVPLCIFTECKLTGPGMEYGGSRKHTVSDQHCLKWNKNRSKVKHKNTLVQQDKFSETQFPEGSVSGAKKFCRNPNEDPGGPWCFVEIENSNEVERVYCDIPFCDDQDCFTYTKNASVYTHYTNFDSSLSNVTFGIKTWSPNSFFEASARIVLSVLALPLTGEEIAQLGIGIEVYMSNKESALKYGNKDTPEYEPSVGVLKATGFTYFSLSWDHGFISLSIEGQKKPIFLAEYRTKKNLLGYKKNKFYYYSFQGTGVLWNFPFCNANCEVHTTTSTSYERFWPLRETKFGHDLKFYIRAFHSIYILLLPSPAVNFPHVKLALELSDSFARVWLVEYQGGPTTTLAEIKLPKLLDYWKWNEFSISLIGGSLEIYITKEVGIHMIAEVNSKFIAKMRWYSPGSENTLAHWTFYCEPPDSVEPPPAWPPECALNKDESGYDGTQAVTSQGTPCLPWSGLPNNLRNIFGRKESLEAWNYCRNPENGPKGTFCYTVSMNSDNAYEKRYCKIRKCKSAECRMAGTGNDYIGHVNLTRSNRTCELWSTVSGTGQIDANYINSTLFADMSVETAENFCRNPSRNIAGSWCYTTDPEVLQDMCDVRDCSKPEECTILVQGQGEGRYIYILPQWKESGIHGGLHFSLKEWNPDLQDGVSFKILSGKRNETIDLVIGAENNQKVLLYYKSHLEREKTLPHLIPSGKWGSFWLQIRQGEILLGYEGVPYALFEWKHEYPAAAFEPMLLSYASIYGKPIGVFFKCDECHTENITGKQFSHVFPLGLWSQTECPTYNNITLRLRGTGLALIPLMLLPGTEYYYKVTVGSSHISFSKTTRKGEEPLASNQNSSLLTSSSWTTLAISYTERNLIVQSNNNTILEYNSNTAMLFYWFSVSAKGGWIIWAANCEPLDIDGPPLDGGWSAWSPWQCSVTCGGGDGFKTRTCSNPRPNIFGRLCQGTPTFTGRCNEFECGDITPNALNKIQTHLKKQQWSLITHEGDRVVLKNDDEILKLVAKESPKSYYEWSLNGIFVNPEPGRIEFRGDDIIIEDAEVQDAGVYVCMLHGFGNKRAVFRVISLSVITKYPVIKTRETLGFTLKSNAVVLGYIYSELGQKWTLNDKVYVDFGITILAVESALSLTSINVSHAGVWKCIIQQSDLGLNWTTNIVKVEVQSPPNIYTHLLEDEVTAPFFSWLATETNVLIAIIFLVIFVFAGVFACLYAYFKWCTLPKRQYKINRRK